MPYRLRENLHWCVCNGRAIFLDLEADRYFCLTSRAEAAFVRLAGGGTHMGDAVALRGLAEQGVLIEDPCSDAFGSSSQPPSPREDLLESAFRSPRLGDVLAALHSEARSACLLRSRPLRTIIKIAEARTRKPRSPPADFDGSLRRIASAFAATALLTSSADRCLVRALALHALCCRRGIYPNLVFGVRVDPFRAHCWVQIDDKVLIGDHEQVRLFTPIMALR